MHRRILSIALPLAFAVVVLGAFVRLKDAGLGCPDWPLCYGEIVGVPSVESAAARYPNFPLEKEKAWIEVAHRYLAAILGLMILSALLSAWKSGDSRAKSLTAILAFLVVGQALLGRWTVTESLRPIAVASHLLGGALILGVLAAAVSRKKMKASPSRILRIFAIAAAVALLVQISLGGWVSANGAGLACPNFPKCGGEWIPSELNWDGFALSRELGENADGNPLSQNALATIHLMHRIGAMVFSLFVLALAFALAKAGAVGPALGIGLFLAIQLSLGILAVVWQLPLGVALAHNAVAAIMAINLSVLLKKLFVR